MTTTCDRPFILIQRWCVPLSLAAPFIAPRATIRSREKSCGIARETKRPHGGKVIEDMENAEIDPSRAAARDAPLPPSPHLSLASPLPSPPSPPSLSVLPRAGLTQSIIDARSPKHTIPLLALVQKTPPETNGRSRNPRLLRGTHRREEGKCCLCARNARTLANNGKDLPSTMGDTKSHRWLTAARRLLIAILAISQCRE